MGGIGEGMSAPHLLTDEVLKKFAERSTWESPHTRYEHLLNLGSVLSQLSEVPKFHYAQNNSQNAGSSGSIH